MKSALARGFTLALSVTVVLAGCTSMPQDPDGTLARIRATGMLRAGASPGGGLVRVNGDAVSGPETDLVEAFAGSLGARVEWRVSGEEDLVEAMEEGELDVIAGGLTDKSPWSDRVALTRPYDEREQAGRQVGQVLAVPLGENALLFALESWLDGRSS